MKIVFLLFFLFSVLIIYSLSLKLPQEDHILHFTSSSYLTYWNYGVAKDVLKISFENRIVYAVSVTSCVGIAKELSDLYLKKTKFSWRDVFSDLAGVAVGCILISNVRI